ncbi:thiol-disulfide oxidoreductase DCC family protein [Primorskyibacter sp. S187A]|uniref:thiol-disulfide oxidoreductase DCC family protein n=1 Tax=Primorskyibacter sp. S187A TaxID=3415130 RepID=UPI003C7E4964
MTTVIFDTDCVLCSSWVHFLLRHERDQSMRFVSAWSDEGQSLAAQWGLSADDLDDTFLVVANGRALTRSDAGLALLAQLRAPWHWARALRIIPRPLRDWIYDRLARNRYQWFGRKPECFVPPPEAAHRFVSAPARPR